MKHVFIVNPISGKENAAETMTPRIYEAAHQLDIQVELLPTKAPKDATEIARRFARGGQPVRLYSVGGDGTLNEVLNGAYPYPNAEVACVPCGSGNDFIRIFGDAEPFLDIAAQMRGSAVPIDLMQTDDGICAAITSTGLDAEVAYNIPKYRRVPLLGGTMAYNLSILEKLAKPLGKELKITIDGKVYTGKYLIATVCNAQHYGGGYRAAPMASLQDGVLDTILVKKISRLLIAPIIVQYKKGEHYTGSGIAPKLADIISWHTGREVLIEPAGPQPFILNVDGECGPAKRLYAKVMPRAGRFVLPQGVQMQ